MFRLVNANHLLGIVLGEDVGEPCCKVLATSVTPDRPGEEAVFTLASARAGSYKSIQMDLSEAIRLAKKHLHRESILLRVVRRKQIQADVEAFKVGAILHQLLGGRRDPRGSATVSRFCEAVRWRSKQTAYNYLKLYEACGSLDSLRRYEFPRDYWIGLAGFPPPGTDSFSAIVRRNLMEHPLRGEDGTPDAGKLREALSVFRAIHARAKENPWNATNLRKFKHGYKADFELELEADTEKEIGEQLVRIYREWQEIISDWEITLSEISREDRTNPQTLIRPAEPPLLFRPEWTKRKKPRSLEEVLRERVRYKRLTELDRAAKSLLPDDLTNLGKVSKVIGRDFRQANLEACSIPAVISDLPYDLDAIADSYADFARMCCRVLTPRGVAVAMIGQEFVHEALNEFRKGGLEYRWTIAYFVPSRLRSKVKHKKVWSVNSAWKPVIVLVPASSRLGTAVTNDFIEAGEADEAMKAVFPHAQDVKGFLQLVHQFTKPGDFVLDPYAGSGTTGVACLRLGRHFLGCERKPETKALAQLRLQAEYARMLSPSVRKK